MYRVLFVCLGNICRSPAAEEMLRHLAKADPECPEIESASCGLGDWHIGHLADERMRDAAKRRGVVLSGKAKAFHHTFWDEYDEILAADLEISRMLRQMAKKPEHQAKVRLMTHYSPCYPNEEVPDPYYLGEPSFEYVLDLLQDACEGIIESIKKR